MTGPEAGGTPRLAAGAGVEQEHALLRLVLSLTEAGATVVASWQQVNAVIVTVAVSRMEPASRAALEQALPALGELTGAVDALADEAQTGPSGPADDLSLT